MGFKMKGFSGFKSSPAKHIKSGGGDHNRINHWDPETESFSRKGHSGEIKQEKPVKIESQKEQNEADYNRKLNALLSKPGLTQADVDEWKKKNPAPTGPLKNIETKQDKTRIKDTVKPEVLRVEKRGLKSDLKTKGKGAAELTGGLQERATHLRKGNKVLRELKGRSAAGREFDKAFAEARKAGKEEFTWRGKSYHTKTKKDPQTDTPAKHAYTPLHKPAPTKFIGALIQGAATSPTLGKGDKDLMKKHKIDKSKKELIEESGTATSA
tara:strand:+ start:96 stop:899 length:804 start_codon:yes stop_codon:yes gene_type:complete